MRQRRDDALSRTSWDRVEALLAEYYRTQGYAVEHAGTGGTGQRFDGGIDLKLRRDDDYIVVECKHWNTKQVTHNPVHQLLGIMVNEGATGAILVTSGEFTDAARRAARKLGHVQLVDGDGLRAMLDPVAEPKPVAGDACGEDIDWLRSERGRVRRQQPGEVLYPGSGTRPSRWPWLIAAVVVLALAFWLVRSPGEPSLSRYRATAEAQMPAQRTPTQHAIESGRVDPLDTTNPTARVPPSASSPMGAAGTVPGDPQDPSRIDSAVTPAEAAEARRRADEAIKVIEATTPEM